MKICKQFFLFVFFFIFCFAVTASSAKETFVLESEILTATFDSEDGSIEILDKRSGQRYLPVYSKNSPAKNYEIEVSHHSGLQLAANLTFGDQKYKIHWIFKDPDTLACSIHADFNQELSDPGFAYPIPVVMDTQEHYLAIPESGGFLYKADGSDMHPILKKKPFYKMYKHVQSMMAMVGMTDLNEGLVYVFDTPADSAYRLEYAEDGPLRSIYTPAVVWRPEMSRWGYSRKVFMHVSGQGGFVSQAKYYRNWLIEKGDYKSLRDKAKERPNVDRLIGAPHAWITSFKHTRSLGLIDDFKKQGIDKLMIKGTTLADYPHYRERGSMVELDYPKHNEFIERANEHGYLVGKYMTYSSIRPYTKEEVHKSLFWNFLMLRDDNFLPYSGILKKDGKRMLGWQNQGVRVSERFGMDELIPEHMNYYKEYFMRHDTMFFDVEGALEHFECYDPNHPMTRRDNVETRKERASYYRNFNPNWIIGTEDGSSDYLLQYYDWIEGPPTAELYADWDAKRKDKNSPYYMGSWNRDADGNAPILYKSCLSDPQMTQWSLDPRKRIPLYELVHGDQIVSVCRWEYPNNKMVDVWKIKDLRNMLWGTAPAYGLTAEIWNEQKEDLVQSMNTVCDWVERVGYDEMINFEYLSADKLVQKSTFSSDRSIVVNFGEKPFVLGNHEIDALGYLIIE